jgi:hypothetical protein
MKHPSSIETFLTQEGVPPVALALGIFLLFVAHAVLTRIGRHPSPLRHLSLNHLAFGTAYAVAVLFVPASIEEKLIGAYVYFVLMYPFFFLLFGQINRGFSLNLCVLALRNGGSITEEEIFRSYGNGRGIAFVKADRLRVMKESGTLLEENGRWRVTTRGRWAVLFNRTLLRALGLDYLGRSA